ARDAAVVLPPRVDVLSPAVELDLGDVGALEEVGEELDELVALRRRPRGPVAGERAPRGLLEVEDVVRDSADLRPPLAGAALLLQLRIVEDLEDPVDFRAELVRGLARPPGGRDEEQRQDDGRCKTATTQSRPRRSPRPCRRCTWTTAPDRKSTRLNSSHVAIS